MIFKLFSSSRYALYILFKTTFLIIPHFQYLKKQKDGFDRFHIVWLFLNISFWKQLKK